MERNFGQLNNGGESGSNKLLRATRNIDPAKKSEDTYKKYECFYYRENNTPLSEIKVNHIAQAQKSTFVLPTLILLIPTIDSNGDPEIEKFFSEEAKFVKHFVKKPSLISEDFILNEKAASHIIVANSFVVFSDKNLWFTGDRGLTPTQ